MRLFRTLLVVIVLPYVCAAQQPGPVQNDSARFANLITQGKASLRVRTVYMTTINESGSKDDYALAEGFGGRLASGVYRGFQGVASAFVVYNVWSSDVNAVDRQTGLANRYERGLFDQEDSTARYNLLRPEELYIRYAFSKSSVTAGRMELNTPFVNTQDGRVNKTMIEGVWVSLAESPRVQFNGGWIWGVSPRSTTRWHSVGSSIGIYPSGVTTDGTASDYAGNVNTVGLALANLVVVAGNTRFSLWDMLIENVMNTLMLQVAAESGKELKWIRKAMFVHQDAVNNGGNADPRKAYINRGAQSNVFSGQLAMKSRVVNVTLNASHTTGDGRYLSPREWGQEPFYTFMAREKNDGLGSVTAASAHVSLSLRKDRLRTGAGYGYFDLPDVTNARLNKYGQPSYHQVNAFAAYKFEGWLSGLDARLMVACKIGAGQTYGNPGYVYNKVDMVNVSLTLDYVINGVRDSKFKVQD